MTNIIEELRKYNGLDGSEKDNKFEEIDDLLWSGRSKSSKYKAEEVHEEFEEGGRWSNHRTRVYKVEQDGETAYFELYDEVPATEMQDGQDCSWSFCEVEPKEVTVIQYVAKGSR